ncbi:MAG: site-specific integrase [Verrucomicrobiae bacterium]|nr:site-specific integrase [Verrucomicrobiae bacterium]
MLEFCFIGAAMKPGAYDAQGRRKYLNKNENRKFLKEADSLCPAESSFCLTLYYSGCRISEALSLTVNDIDWETHVIRFRSLKKRDKVVIRRVPIPASLSKKLKSLEPGTDDLRLWQFSRSTGWRIVKSVMKKAQITGIHATAKGLRHGFGVRGAMERIPVHLLRDWMGHADISTTAIYLDIRDEEERELIKRTW